MPTSNSRPKDEPLTPTPTEESKNDPARPRGPKDAVEAAKHQKNAVPGQSPKSKGSIG